LSALDAAKSAARWNIVLLDSTNFTTLFGGTDSLKNLWRNFRS
jgi:hypothetical protein